MSASEYRAKAREILTGKWGKGALLTLVFIGFSFILGFVEGLLQLPQGVTNLIDIIINVPIMYGLTICFLKLYKSENFQYTDIFTEGFTNFKRSWIVQLYTVLKLLVPIIIVFVATVVMVISAGVGFLGGASGSTGTAATGGVLLIISSIGLFAGSILYYTKSLYYSLSIFLAIENPEMPEKEAVEKSKELMTGKRAKFFLLQLSFIGWAFLAGLTLGIGYFWLVPYMIITSIVFYKSLIGDTTTPVQNENVEVNSEPVDNQSNND